jgi:hypothetical protein
MRTQRFTLCAGSLALAVLFVSTQFAPAADVPAAGDNGVTVLARGPVHEAFAQPSARNPEPTPVIPKRPPDPIPEEPPDQKPQGENVQWMPGYWAWDAERKDYLWVSGVWRIPPPDRTWMPGYWGQVDGGWQWVPGYWGAANQEAPQFLPAPPLSVEEGPSGPAPNDTSIYVPGSWIYRTTGYAWRPGFWSAGHADWVWNAGYYTWTPAGVVYVNGYWDYALAQRGMLFAPVAFNQPLWTNPGWVYRPSYVIGVNGLLGSLFIQPGAYSYYFGNYYSPLYASLGFSPWYSYGRRNWDPLFTYYRWTNRGNPLWANQLQATFVARRDGARVPSLVTPLNQFRGEALQTNRLSAAQLARERSDAERRRAAMSARSELENSQPRQSFYRGPAASDLGTMRPSTVISGGNRGTVFQSNPPPRGVQSLPPPPTFRGGPSGRSSGSSSSGGHSKDGGKNK